MKISSQKEKIFSEGKAVEPADLFTVVTNKIITALEKGTSPWRKPWQTCNKELAQNHGLPVNAITGRAYSGINVMLLWIDTYNKGFNSHQWLTFKQAIDAGGHVRKGEKSTLVTLFKPYEKPATDSHGQPVFDANGEIIMSRRSFITSFHLFNTEQCDGLSEQQPHTVPMISDSERMARVEQVVACGGVKVTHSYQDRAFYSSMVDRITMPERIQFNKISDYYSTLLHELVHSTGHASRLARDGIVSMSRRFGNPVYAFEELVAEIGSAFLCAELGIQGEVQHDSYIASWLKVLKEDNRAIFRAGRYAREAFEYLILREQALVTV
ncbi:TPA: DUF1738 domain-containing protein [Yersinia enterocolitica]|nr:DUF1738 domain-containing protein [Yersinia enterocolitica]